jgi:hypothetical protein
MMTIISQAELNRIRNLASSENSPASKNNQKLDVLRTKSQNRVGKWSNTLEAIRKKKEMFILEKAKQREANMLKLDIEVNYTVT